MFVDIKKLEHGKEIRGRFAVKSKDKRNEGLKDYRDFPGKFFSIKIGNKTGEMPLKFWGKKEESSDVVEKIYHAIEVGDIIEVCGSVKNDPYDKCIAIHIDERKYDENLHYIRKLSEDEIRSIDFSEFITSLETEKIESMFNEVIEIIKKMKNEKLKELLKLFFLDKTFALKFKLHPAAKKNHHAYIGGLLEHSLNVAKLCMKMSEFYELDRDLLIASALLHDIGKLREYEITKGAIDRSEEGMLIGHVVIGKEEVKKRIESIKNFPEDLELKILHMILSHHGELEYGSPVKPGFAEAMALYFCDLADSQVNKAVKGS